MTPFFCSPLSDEAFEFVRGPRPLDRERGPEVRMLFFDLRRQRSCGALLTRVSRRADDDRLRRVVVTEEDQLPQRARRLLRRHSLGRFLASEPLSAVHVRRFALGCWAVEIFQARFVAAASIGADLRERPLHGRVDLVGDGLHVEERLFEARDVHGQMNVNTGAPLITLTVAGGLAPIGVGMNFRSSKITVLSPWSSLSLVTWAW